jgi:hypothetical protein
VVRNNLADIDRNHQLAIVAAVVLMSIVAGFASGIYMSNPRALAH